MWLYCEDDQWVECELLHEFMYDYQMHYKDVTGETIEKIVKREDIKSDQDIN